MPITPNDNDVLFGRGRSINSHPGNGRLRSMVQAQKSKFQQAKRGVKRTIAKNIVGAIQSMGGRFLMEDPQNTNQSSSTAEKVWVCADEAKALKKVMHRLRERDKANESEEAATVSHSSMREKDGATESVEAAGEKDGANEERAAVSHGSGGVDARVGVPSMQQQQLPSSGNDLSIHTGRAAVGGVQSLSNPTNTLGSTGMHPSMGNLGFMPTLAAPSANNAGALAALAQSLGLGNLGSASGLTIPPSNNLASILGHVGTQQSMMNSLGFSPAARQLIGTATMPVAGGHAHGAVGAGAMPPVDLLGMLSRARMQQPIVGPVSSQNNMTHPVSSSSHDGKRASAVPSNNAPANTLSSSMSAQHSVGKQTTDQHCQSASIESGTAAEGLARRPHSSFHSLNSDLQGKSLSADGITGSPITVSEWIESASDLPTKTAYIIGSVELAWRIARHLGDLVRARATLNPWDNASENLRIFVERPLWSHDASDTHPCRPSIQRIEFATSESGAPLQERDACASLGRILMKIFGMNQTSLDAPVKRERGDDGLPPAPKRQATEPGYDSISTRASGILMALRMPVSITRLVCDLLDAANEESPRTAIVSLDEALWDLGQMRKDPESSLFDKTCPQKALEHLFRMGEDVFGREKELNALLQAKSKLSTFVRGGGSALVSQEGSFLCQAAFVGGYAGSGKSTLLLPLMHACNEEQWFVLSCKFDKQTEPVKVLCRALDAFFGRWGDHDGDSSLTGSFRQVCERISSTIDDDGLCQLSELLPSFAKLYPMATMGSQEEGGISSMDKVGSAQNRLHKLIHVLFESIGSAGRPVLVTLDDLQWSDSFVLEGLTDFVVNYMPEGVGRRRGFFIAGTYRSNEVAEEGGILMKSINAIKDSRHVYVTMLTTGELAKCDVTELISAKLCLPRRYTQPLANVVHTKTRGNPFFVIQFLRSIVANKMLEFSVESKRWIWDCDVVDMQMISDGVAGLLAASFNQLPSQLTKTMKIASCLGYQVEKSTVDALDSRREVLPFSILDQMGLAVKEGILERAGPVYQFTHDLVQQSIYDLIPPGSRGLLHKRIGQGLLNSATNEQTIHLLAADQMNIFCRDGTPSLEERSQIASCNAVAAKFAIADSSFERARSYIDMGIRLLEPNHWETQYPLSLSLFEMSATVSCINGDSAAMSSCLEAVLSHVMTFEDSLKASSMLAKLLASNSKYDDARSNCLEILKTLGEQFPAEVSPSLVKKELPAMQTVLRNVTYDRIKQLSPMTDNSKLNAMKFLNMLCTYCVVSKPLLVPLLSCRMVKIALEYGFCEDAIVGIATAGYTVFLFTEDVHLAAHLGKVSELLIEESPKRHLLRSRLCRELFTTLKAMHEPHHLVAPLYPELYNSAMLAGDVENAVTCCFAYCAGGLWTAHFPLSSVLRHLDKCIREASKYQQNTVQYSAMALYHACMFLTGQKNDELEIKSLDELNAIGVETKSVFLIWQTFMCRINRCFWMRDFSKLAEMSTKYSEKHPTLQQKRILQVLRVFCEGIAYLSLARGAGNTKKWRALGEKAVATVAHFEATMSKWNWENKSLLLQAELHYLNGDIESADTAYEGSIKSAREHKFMNEEALAYELHGIFCVENSMAGKGAVQLRTALSKYKEWGALKKARQLQLYIDSFH